MTVDNTAEREAQPASPVLWGLIEQVVAELHRAEDAVHTLQQEEDRVRHRLTNERLRRERLEADAATAPVSLDAAERSRLSSDILQTSDEIKRLQTELTSVREHLRNAEEERDRLRSDLENLESVRADLEDRIELQFARAQFEQRRYERAEEFRRALEARVLDLEAKLLRAQAELAEMTTKLKLYSENPRRRR